MLKRIQENIDGVEVVKMVEVGYCDTSKLSIRQIDKRTAKKMVVNHHYSNLWT